jgi:potassium inwardly-rectifying channel subfamily J
MNNFQLYLISISLTAKLTRPKKRAQNLLFSSDAVIFSRNGALCFAFRIADVRRTHIVHADIRAFLIKKVVTNEGEHLPFYQQEMSLTIDGSDKHLMFIWPTLVVHKIDEKSPLYGITADTLQTEDFEIVVMLEGAVESTGLAAQARSSYLPHEIYWNHRFDEMVTQDEKTGRYEVINFFLKMLIIEII